MLTGTQASPTYSGGGLRHRSLSSVAAGLAALIPALLIGYSALIDPLINFDLAVGYGFGGVSVGADQKSTFVTQIFMPVILLVSLALAACSSFRPPKELFFAALPGVLFLALAFASVAWSRDSGNTLTLAIYQSIIFSTLLVSVAVAANPDKILRYLLLMFAVAVAVNLVAVILRPPSPIGHAGIYDHKNTLGGAAGCAFMFGFFHLFRGGFFTRAIALFTVAGALVLTLASYSKTALALVLMAPVLSLGLYVTVRVLRLGVLPVLALFATGLFSLGYIFAHLFRLKMDDIFLAVFGSTSFTGRREIWEFVWDYIAQAPILGNGYRAFWTFDESSPKHSSQIEFIRLTGSSHSGYIDTALDLGLVGVCLLAFLILTVLFMTGRLRVRPVILTLFYMSIVIFVLARNGMESVIMWSTFVDNLCFLLVGFLACYRHDLPDRSRRAAVGSTRAGRV
ncbi:MAG: O-antigen ligase family protein [Filomicrobium sp.]